MQLLEEYVNYGIFTKENPLVISRQAVETAISQHPEMERDFLSVIKRGIVKVLDNGKNR